MDKKKLVSVVLSAAVTGLIDSLKDRYRTKQIGTRLAALDARLADLDTKVDRLIPKDKGTGNYVVASDDEWALYDEDGVKLRDLSAAYGRP